jgi:hypothetical protein
MRKLGSDDRTPRAASVRPLFTRLTPFILRRPQTMNTNMNLRSMAILAIAALLLSSCATPAPTIGFEANRESDFANFKTYAVLPLPQTVQGADPGTAVRVALPMKEEIQRGMAAKGYREVPVEQADLILNIRGKVVGKTDVTDWGYSYAGYGRWGGYYDPYGGVSVDQYNEGTLSIEAFNRQKQVTWVGWATGRLADKPDEARLRATIAEVVAKFPAAGMAPAPAPAKK